MAEKLTFSQYFRYFIRRWCLSLEIWYPFLRFQSWPVSWNLYKPSKTNSWIHYRPIRMLIIYICVYGSDRTHNSFVEGMINYAERFWILIFYSNFMFRGRNCGCYFLFHLLNILLCIALHNNYVMINTASFKEVFHLKVHK